MDDLIRRCDVLDNISKRIYYFDKSSLDEARNAVHNAPAVAAISRWISVEERLPEHMDDVLIWVGGLVEVGYYDENNECWELYTYVGDGSVTHWMHLPEPPKESP